EHKVIPARVCEALPSTLERPLVHLEIERKQEPRKLKSGNTEDRGKNQKRRNVEGSALERRSGESTCSQTLKRACLPEEHVELAAEEPLATIPAEPLRIPGRPPGTNVE